MGRSSTRSQAGALLRRALDHHRAGRLGDAEPAYRRLLSQDGDDPDLLYLLGMLLGQTSRPDDSLPDLASKL